MKKYDNTALSTLQRCEQEYVWRHVRHLAGTAPSGSAYFGQMVHLGVQALYNAMGDAAAAQELIRSKWQMELDPKRKHLSVEQATAIVAEYAKVYSAQPYDLVWNEGYAESATECALPDRAVRAHADKKLYAMDLKTTGMYISSSWQRSFEHSQQVAMQLDVLEAELGERVEGFILDAVNVRAAVGAGSFVRYGPLVYSDALRAELRQHRQRVAERADKLAELPQAALKAPSACVRYNELCPYFDLCHADPADREALVQIKLDRKQLEEKAWKPSERD